MKSLTQKLLVTLMLIGAGLQAGCGAPEPFDSGIQGRGAADLKAALNCGPAPVLSDEGEAAADLPELSRAPVDYLRVQTISEQVSLCDAQRVGGKALTVLTFNDPACADCMAYTVKLSNEFVDAAYAANVQTVAVMVPSLGADELTAAGADSANSTWISDVDMGLWHFFNPDAANDLAMVTPVGVVLDGEGRGFVLKNGEDAAAIWGMILAAYREAPAPD